METSLTNQQIDKVLKPYWDDKFKGATLSTVNDWTGLAIDTPQGKDIIVGFPIKNASMVDWYYDGPYFYNEWLVFGVTTNEFRDSMKRYLQNNFGVEIRTLM